MPRKTPRKTPREKFLETEPIRHQNADMLDRQMHQALKEGGEPVLDNDGKVQLDGDGKVIRRPLSAAAWNAIRSRLKDCGITGDAKNPESPLNALHEHAREALKLGPLPPVSEEPDAATRIA